MSGMSRKKAIKHAKGFLGRSKSCNSLVRRAVDHALIRTYRSRRLHKREIRKTWIAQINAAARQYDINYGTFILRSAMHNLRLNRKMLAELAIYEPLSFRAVTKEVMTPVPEEVGYGELPIEQKESS